MEIRRLVLGIVNAYLIKTQSGSFLIDTGLAVGRSKFEHPLARESIKPGEIKLVIATHGDPDHIGNCAYLQKKYGLKIAIHVADADLCRTGKRLSNRKRKSSAFSRFRWSVLNALIIKPLMKNFPLESFEPDIILYDGYDFGNFGFDAKVVHLPGHSSGSIGILTADRDFFAGDTISNRKKPAFADIVENEPALAVSLEKIRTLNIRNVYPGHGKPFSMAEFKL